jgi:branched-chain amino acid transport system ATP-binding protein
MGFLKPQSGSITFAGKELTGRAPNEIIKLGISLVPQSMGIFPLMSVEKNLEVGAWTFRREKDRVKEEIERVFQRYPFLRKKKDEKASSLSGGEQRILDIAKSLIVNPKMILADEPTAGLSVKFYSQVYSELEALQKDHHQGVVLVDQNIRGAIGISDYVYVLDSGRNSSEGSRADFDEGSLKEIVQSWLGFE